MPVKSLESAHVRGVQYIPAKDGWQVTHSGKYLGFFKKQQEAIACKASKLNISAAELRRKASQPQAAGSKEEPRRFKNVTPIASGWQAHKWEDGKLIYLGFAASDNAAAAMVEEHTGKQVSILFNSPSLSLPPYPVP